MNFQADTFKIFMSVQPSEGHCEGCPFMSTTIEEYEIWGCKERTKEINCTGTHLDCQIVEGIASDVECFIQDNADMFNIIGVTG
jgi:hypothetical protein